MYKIVICDDHVLLCDALKKMVEQFENFKVIQSCNSGKELLKHLQEGKNVPDLILLDINMPIMDGFATMKQLHNHYPSVKVLVLTMEDSEENFLRMIRSGAHGFISKGSAGEELRLALNNVMERGCYYTPEMADSLFRSMSKKADSKKDLISERERELLELVCTEMTYQQIANQMCLSPKTIDGYRNSLFQKLHIKSRVGLAMYAVREGYFKL